MRSEQEMLDLILSTARADQRIRAVMLNGSRANPNAPRDFFQDFDIIYFVTELDSFKQTPDWIDRFGERMILQLPDDMGDPPANDWGGTTYLIQFMDGNRIDLGLYPISKLAQREADSQTIVLLDKDGLLGDVPPPSDRDTLPRPPTAKQFADCCNEFWWVSPYVAKGLWRQELPYAKRMLEDVVRRELEKMLNWLIGMRYHYTANPGKLGKYYHKVLAPGEWELWLKTYSDAGYEQTWQALFAMARLFRMAALQVAQVFGFDYPHSDDRRVSAHLEHVHRLPRDVGTMY